MPFLNNIETTKFLESYWEKKHLFLPNSFKTPELSLTKAEIFEMALDDGYETRLISQDKNNQWSVQFGPLNDLEEIKAHKLWTLFIHNFNLHEQFSNELQNLVKFIPTWLFDDVLCSFSGDGSSVGAHFDRYNVFILQVSGKRTWKIQEKPKKTFRRDCPIKILESFEADVEYTLNPGDMIFIPPECGHEGTSIGESISLSIGFKSLETAQIVQFFASEVLASVDETDFYKTSVSDFSSSSSEISRSLLEKLFNETKKNLQDFEIFKTSMLKFLTASKSESYLQNEEIDFSDFCHLISHKEIFFAEEIRYIKYQDEFWINQSKFELGDLTENEVSKLIDKRFELENEDIEERFHPLLYQMYQKDLISFSDFDE